MLAARDVRGSRHVVLEPDVVGDRLGHYPGAAYHDSSGNGTADDAPPARLALTAVERRAAFPGNEGGIVRHVGIAHLQMHGCVRRAREQFLKWRHRDWHRSPP